MSNKKQKSPEPETAVDVTTDKDFKGLIVVALMNLAALNVTLPARGLFFWMSGDN